MSKFVLLITPHIEASHQIGEAWQTAGAPGVTLVESHGLYRLQKHAKSAQILPGMMSMLEIMRQNEEHNVMIFSVVDDHLVDVLITEAEAIIGSMDEENNGVIFVLDVERVLGMRRIKPGEKPPSSN